MLARRYVHGGKINRTVGLIGGMSWQTTALYYSEINKQVGSRLGGLHSANLLLRSLDYDTIAGMVSTGNFDDMTDLFCKAGQDLKAAGAQALVLCANVAHKAADTLEKATGLTVLHIVDCTGQKIVERNFTRAGLLATRAVMEEEFYKARLRDRFGLEIFVPNDEEFRAQADHQIFNEMSKDEIPEGVRSAWHKACSQLVRDHQVDCIILGCTELRLLFSSETMAIPTFETTTLHARGIADWLLDGNISQG